MKDLKILFNSCKPLSGRVSLGGGGNHEELLKYFGGACFEKQRCQDAKRHGLLRFELFKKIDKFLSLNLRNILISPLEGEKGEKKFLSELCELRNYREGYNLKNSCRHRNADLPKQLRCIPLNKFLILGRKFNLFFETVFSRFTSHFSLKRKAAFTLAEVLITLGVIGIVSALTMPAVINHFKAKKLEVQFKTADAMLTKAIKMTVNELGYEDLKDLHLNYYVSSLDNNGGEPRRNLEALNDVWVKQFKGAK